PNSTALRPASQPAGLPLAVAPQRTTVSSSGTTGPGGSSELPVEQHHVPLLPHAQSEREADQVRSLRNRLLLVRGRERQCGNGSVRQPTRRPLAGSAPRRSSPHGPHPPPR